MSDLQSNRANGARTAERSRSRTWLSLAALSTVLCASVSGCGGRMNLGGESGSGSGSFGGSATNAGAANVGIGGGVIGTSGAAGAIDGAGDPETRGGATGQTSGSAGEMNGGTGGDAGALPSDTTLRVVNWSFKKMLVTPRGNRVVQEEVLQSFFETTQPPSRLRVLGANGETAEQWAPPADYYISDFTLHPSGEYSVALVNLDHSIALARLGADLSQLALSRISDPAIVNDPHAADAGVKDLTGNGFVLDPARIGALGETAVLGVFSGSNAVIVYRIGVDGAGFSQQARTLVEPSQGLPPFLPTGGSFDTFGAIGGWFRCPLDVDEDGNIFVAVWAAPYRIKAHVSVFQDGLTPLPGDPAFPSAGDSDLLLTKLDSNGERQWTRVVGSIHEDEPYALRAREGFVAVVGRARRFPGNDNTAWDALVSVSRSNGDLVGTRTLASNDSSILLAVDRVPGTGWLLGGSDGWAENPDGLSILQFGTKLLLELDSLAADGPAPTRFELEAGPRNNQLNSVLASPSRFWFAGHEDGPIMHTGDSDHSLIYSTAVLGSIAR